MKLRHHARRPGISELVGSVLAIAITVIAGAAVFGYVNGQAGVTENQYGSSVGVTVNYLQEQFSVIDMSFTSSSQVVLYLYNYGRIAVSPIQVTVYNETLYLTYNATKVTQTEPTACSDTATTSNENPLLWNTKTSTGTPIDIGSISTLTLSLPGCSGVWFASGSTYFVKVTGLYGNVVVNSQVKLS